ncbi:hypothetical protein AeRB84_010815 [Aphanomyces euteiches]|nr:hypothetical protein AeRB84_010815 [Aphanomyces euteiches]
METAGKFDLAWMLRMQSLRVVDIEHTPLQPSLPSTDDCIVTIESVGFLTMIYKLGDSVPGVGKFELPQDVYIQVNMTDGLQLILCSEFNFQGTCQSYSRNVSYKEELKSTFKSYKVVRTGDIASSQNSSDFVGCFPPVDPYIEWTPIFLQANDTVNELIYPWDQNIAKFTVPRGMVVAAFSEPFLKGDCFAWTTDADDLGHWNKSIRSLMATTTAAWSGCPLELKDQNNSTSNTSSYIQSIIQVVTTQRPSPSMESSSKSFNYLPLVIACGFGVFLFGLLVLRHAKRRNVMLETASTTMECSGLQWRDLDLYRLPPIALTHQIATGATSTIYLGKLKDQPVAIKKLTDATPDKIQTFIDEITYVTQLSSPYIVSVIGVAWTNAMDLQCVMEYMNLGDLRSYLENVKSFSWESKVSCALSVAEGLFYLHIQQLIHRDVKSRNILMDSVKGAKLGDFGPSKEVIFGDTMTAVVGTLRWMAPEMMLFKPYSSAVDIYSFGVVLSELSTHELPYASALDAKGRALSEEGIARCVIHDMMRPSFGNCPEWFSELGMKCMAQSPEDRPTAVQIIHQLKAELKALRS